MSLITLQILDLDDFFDDFFDLDDVGPLTNQFETLGYESLYVYKNLGTVVLGIFIPLIIWFFAYTMISLIFKKYEPYKQRISDIIFFN